MSSSNLANGVNKGFLNEGFKESLDRTRGLYAKP